MPMMPATPPAATSAAQITTTWWKARLVVHGVQAAAEVLFDRRERDVDDGPVDGRDPGTEDCRDERGLLSAAHSLERKRAWGQIVLTRPPSMT
jgi:hypothetical protein